MTRFDTLGESELAALKDQLDAEYAAIKAKGLSLNMARGKPGADQLDLSTPLLGILATAEDCLAEDGTDCRNYGVVDGLPEAKRLMAARRRPRQRRRGRQRQPDHDARCAGVVP